MEVQHDYRYLAFGLDLIIGVRRPMLKAVQGVGRLLNHAGAESRTPDCVKFLANLDLIGGKIFTQLRGLSADDSAQDPADDAVGGAGGRQALGAGSWASVEGEGVAGDFGVREARSRVAANSPATRRSISPGPLLIDKCYQRNAATVSSGGLARLLLPCRRGPMFKRPGTFAWAGR
jgi:hypothetical protein